MLRPMMILAGLLLVITLLLYAVALGMITSMHSSDAAGNGLTQSFAFLTTIALWIFLSALLVVAGIKGEMPPWISLAAFILVPAAAAAALGAVNLLTDSFYKSKWPVLIPALLPLLIIAFALWALFPTLHAGIPPAATSPFIWGAVLVLSLAPWPAVAYRKAHGEADRAQAVAEDRANEPKRIEAERQQNLALFKQLTPDSPLRDWLAFRLPSNELREQAFEGIRKLPRRQADAELMLRQGLDYFWDDWPQLNLEPSPIVCQSARKFLRERIEDLKPQNPAEPPKFSYMVDRIDPYLSTVKWFAEHHCGCGPELAALEEVVRSYPDSPDRNRVLNALLSLHL